MNLNLPSFAGKVSPTATNMIRMDHTHVMATFHQYELDSSPRTRQGLANTICLALEIHAQLEEEIFYPAMKALDSSNPAIQKAVPEHNEMKRLIARLRSMQPTEAGYDDTLFELMRDVMHHVADEETIILPEAERLMADRLGDLGAQMLKRRRNRRQHAQGHAQEHDDAGGRRADGRHLPDETQRQPVTR